MEQAAPTGAERAKPLAPPPISLRELWPWCLFGAALLLVLLFIVGVEGSAISIGPGEWIHEFAHDGRHLLAFPCH
jgi:cobalt transporter subunit CbtB